MKISFESLSCLILQLMRMFFIVFPRFVNQDNFFFNDRILGYSSTSARCYIHKIAPTNFLKQRWNCLSCFSVMCMRAKGWQVCFRFVFFCSLISCASFLHFTWLNGKFWRNEKGQKYACLKQKLITV